MLTPRLLRTLTSRCSFTRRTGPAAPVAQIGTCRGRFLTPPLLDPHDEDLIEGLGAQAVQLFTFSLSYHGSLLFLSGHSSRFYRYLPYGTTVAEQGARLFDSNMRYWG